MLNRLTSMLVLSLILVGSGCSRTINDSDIKQNPHPKQRYEITVTIDGAPGPFDSAVGFMGYEIANPDCVPQDPFSGARPAPHPSPAFNLVHISGDVYGGALYLDLLQDGDYYGLGVCHWKMSDANIWLKVRDVTFTSYISMSDLLAQKSVRVYFSKDSYVDTRSKDLFDSGMPKGREQYAVQHPEQFFSVSLFAKEAMQ